jgi:hypothetical protein
MVEQVVAKTLIGFAAVKMNFGNAGDAEPEGGRVENVEARPGVR